jgi:hypothetical protein
MVSRGAAAGSLPVSHAMFPVQRVLCVSPTAFPLIGNQGVPVKVIVRLVRWFPPL